MFGRTDDTYICSDVFGYFGAVDVTVDDPAPVRAQLIVGYGAVRETRADCYQQVALFQRRVCRAVAVHTRHAEHIYMRKFYSHTGQCSDNRYVRFFGKSTQRFRRFRAHRAAAREYYRAV